jgi:hypothetical protein
LFDADCNYICASSGGLAGTGDMKCTDFKENAKHPKLVWKMNGNFNFYTPV